MTKTHGKMPNLPSRGATIHTPGVRSQHITVKPANALKPGLATAAPAPATPAKGIAAIGANLR